MFKHILAPLDGSALAESALPHLVALARIGQPQVTLLRVMDPDGPAARPVDPFDWQLQKAEAETYLQDVCRRLDAVGLHAQSQILEGRAADTILEFCNDNEVDLLVVSSHGQSGISGWNVSGVVQKVILRARSSVMISRAYQETVQELGDLRYKRILVPLDGSARAEVVMPVAAALARSHQSTLIASHIVQKPPMPRRTPPSAEDVQLADQLTERNRVEASRYLDEIPAHLDVKAETRLLIEDRAVSALHRQVEAEGVDLVCLSAHGYSGESRWPYGSVVISFIAYGTTPLLIIQDLPPERIEPTAAEVAARELGRR